MSAVLDLRILRVVVAVLFLTALCGHPSFAVEDVVFQKEFSEMAFGVDGSAALARRNADRTLQEKIEVVDTICELTVMQKQRLQLAGRGDIKRLFEEIEEFAPRYRPQVSDQDRIDQLMREFEPLRQGLTSGPFDEGSLFDKMLTSVLTDEQRAKYEYARRIIKAGGRIRSASSDRGVGLHIGLPAKTDVDESLSLLVRLPHVVEIDLGNTAVTETQLTRLQQLSEPSSLRWLRLAKTRIGDEGLKSLNAMTGLEYLDLSGTLVTDAGLARLTGAKNLRRLFLEGTATTTAGVRDIKRRWPQIQVVR